MDWIRLHSKGILRGSLATSDDTTQLIWVKLLAMANETKDRDGILRYKKDRPYSLEFIATTCNTTLEALKKALAIYSEDIRDGIPRIRYDPDGSLVLCNWGHYQSNPSKKQPDKKPKTEEQLKVITRQMTNQFPDEARNVLGHDFQDSIVTKDGEIIGPHHSDEHEIVGGAI